MRGVDSKIRKIIKQTKLQVQDCATKKIENSLWKDGSNQKLKRCWEQVTKTLQRQKSGTDKLLVIHFERKCQYQKQM